MNAEQSGASIGDPRPLARRGAIKLCVSSAAVPFTAIGSLTGMQMHPLLSHPESKEAIAMEVGIYSHSTTPMIWTRATHQDPKSYLLPLPNPPPARA